MTKLVQPLKWWGGKHYLAKQIIKLMPRHLHYVDPSPARDDAWNESRGHC